jgi:predicted DNA-binding transcriptional regulator AlpA
MAPTAPTPDEVRSWPVTVDVRTAGRAWGLGRDQAYRLAREGRFPVPVLHLGRYLRVTRASVLEALGMSETRHNGHHDDLAM